MTKFAVLHTNKDFRTLYYRGKSQVHPGLVTYVRRNRLGIPRAGITASKKLGNAVQRNRCRPGHPGGLSRAGPRGAGGLGFGVRRPQPDAAYEKH